MSGRRILSVVIIGMLPIFGGITINAATTGELPAPLNLIQRYPGWSLLIYATVTVPGVLWQVRQSSERPALNDSDEARLRAHLLAWTRRIWVDGVLARSLAEVLRQEVSLVSTPSRVNSLINVKMRDYGADDEAPQPGTPPGVLFRYLHEQLLILGEPGAGKTTWLLELARDLATRAEENVAAHVPVVLPLHSWPADNKVTFDRWVIDELHNYYGLKELEARYILDHSMAALLLDGLDEIPTDRIAQCIKALNTFRDAHRRTPIAITCRVLDYHQQVKPLLDLASAVEIEPLTSLQADRWLASIGSATNGLRASMQQDESLRLLLRTPLTLSIAALAYRDREVVAFTGLDSLFEAYTQTMLHRPRAMHGKPEAYDEAKVRNWLTSLAKGMAATDTWVLSPSLPTRFRIPWFDQDTLPWRRIRRKMLARGAVPVALLSGLTTLLAGPWQAAPAVGLLAAAVACSPGANKDEDFRRGKTGVASLLVMVSVTLLLLLPVLRAIGESRGTWLLFRIILCLMVCLLGVALAAIIATWTGAVAVATAFVVSAGITAVSSRIGRQGSVVLALLVLTTAGLTAGALGGFVGGYVSVSTAHTVLGADISVWVIVQALATVLLAGPVSGLILAAEYNISDTYAPQAAYRFFASTGALPRDLARFLAWADSRLLLGKNGDDYTFRHRLYREWWAAQGT